MDSISVSTYIPYLPIDLDYQLSADDLSPPHQTKYPLWAPVDPGLSELLLERAPLEECLLPTSVPNLDLVTRGTSISNPGEIFLGARLDQFLRDTGVETQG